MPYRMFRKCFLNLALTFRLEIYFRKGDFKNLATLLGFVELTNNLQKTFFLYSARQKFANFYVSFCLTIFYKSAVVLFLNKFHGLVFLTKRDDFSSTQGLFVLYFWNTKLILKGFIKIQMSTYKLNHIN